MTERILYALFAALLLALTVYGLLRAFRPRPDARAPVVAATVVWLAAVAFMTIRPGNGRGVRLNLIPIVFDGRGSAFDALLNVGVFVPLGLLLLALGWRLLAALGTGLGVSLTIEVIQYVTDAGRTADVNDLITNTLGTAIGWAVGYAVTAVRNPRDT